VAKEERGAFATVITGRFDVTLGIASTRAEWQAPSIFSNSLGEGPHATFISVNSAFVGTDHNPYGQGNSLRCVYP